jgi:hypothetical protein
MVKQINGQQSAGVKESASRNNVTLCFYCSKHEHVRRRVCYVENICSMKSESLPKRVPDSDRDREKKRESCQLNPVS